MTRHPAEFWIKFLLSRREHTFDEVIRMCEMADLGSPKLEYLAVLDGEMRAELPVPFKGHDKRHRPSSLFLRQQGVYEAWHRDRWLKAALDLLGDTNVRPLLETFLLSPLKPAQIIKKVNKVTGADIDERTLDRFRHYFWNVGLLNSEEWGEFIQRRRVAHSEWLRLAITSRGPQGVQFLLWKTGTGPIRHADAGKIFTNLRNIAYMKALELEHEPASKDHSVAFSNYVKAAKAAQEEVTASASAMMDILDSFKAFKMRTMEGGKAQTVLELTDGGDSFSEAEDAASNEEKIRMEDY